jgi:hypothetical protein
MKVLAATGWGRTPVARNPNAAASRESVIPWYLWCAALAVTSAYVGGYWDIAWHRSIGRDTFWTPPHLAIYACGVLAGLVSSYLIFAATFASTPSLRQASARIWGLSGPLGAFACAWGALAMLVSAPFDDWWHGAYGLDVRIISPPHMVLAGGFFAIELGAIMLLLASMNRADVGNRRSLCRLFLYVGGTMLCESLLIRIEFIDRSDMHSALFYVIVALGTPAILVALAVASRVRWACTIMAAIYTGFSLALLWILPLVPAQPKLGPVYRPITHLIPWEFPLLIVVPAAAIDLILQRTGRWRSGIRALATGLAFLVVFVAVQWPFASFLMTPAARNWIFGTAYFDFNMPARALYARYLFIPRETTSAQFWQRMSVAGLTACGMSWIGLYAGRLMERVRR